MQLEGSIEKAWGQERTFVSNSNYCGKLLKFNTGAKGAMHYHAIKEETWYVLSGKFKVRTINTQTAQQVELLIQEGNTWTNSPLVPHQLECIEEGVVIEMSTVEDLTDTYRILPGSEVQDPS